MLARLAYIQCFGVSISYLIIIKVSSLYFQASELPLALTPVSRSAQTLTPTALTTIYTLIAPSSPVPSFLSSGSLWLLVSMAVNIPLSFFKRLDSFVLSPRHFSAAPCC